MEGIKAYKGTIESAEQTLSFLITFIFRGRGNVEGVKRAERNVHEEPRDLVISSNVQGKKRRELLIHLPKGSFKENSMLFDFSPKTIMNALKLLPQ